MRLPSVISFSLVVMSLIGCGGAAGSDENSALSAEASALRGHLEFLASDELRGRDTGSRGHEIASLYIASEFKQLGLEPAGDDGTYFQRINFRSSTLKENTARLAISYGDDVVELNYPKEFLTAPSAYHEQVNVTAPMVFVGYGLVSEAFDINDYDGLDVSGKVVVTLAGRPEFLPSEEGAHLNRNKAKYAAERGAVGMLSIHTPAREKVRPFKVSALYQRAPNLVWLNADGEPNQIYKGFTNLGSVDTKAAENLFRKAPVDLPTLLLQTENDESPRGFALNASVTLAKESVHEAISSPNVAAVLPGTDDQLKDEYVLYTAHSDHVGVTRDLSQDDHINNGAMDNASGVSVMLETARMFAESAQRPKRSVLFLAVTAEERGLLGADYYAHYPTVPINQIVANVNLDMPVLLYDFADIIAFGSTHSTLGDTVAEAAGSFGIELSGDPMPEQAIFTRSDHYAFVKQGVPAVFLMTGFTAKDEDKNGGEIWGEFFEKHYHRPSDSPDLPINYEAGVVFTNINFAIGQQIANADERPRWLPDSFFGQLNDSSDR